MLRVITDQTGGRVLARFRTAAAPVEFGSGFYPPEAEDLVVFRWMSDRGELHFEASDEDRYLELWVFSSFHDLSQVMTCVAGSESVDLALPHGWSRLSVPIPAGSSSAALATNKPFPPAYYPGDSRTLSVRVRSGAYLHPDPDRHAHIERQFRNAIANRHEMLTARSVLESTPPHLGIDMYGVCNVKPPCVYCEWDWAKGLEGDNVDAPFGRQTLENWGEIFGNSTTLVNCSIGEPFMMKNIDELFDIFGDSGKTLEMTTNGQILTDRNIEKLLHRDIELYISLDAATPQTYASLRNDTFEKILGNLRRLITAKGGRDGQPKVHLVFMPMRCNVEELDRFIELCAELEVDRLVLRPLNYSDSIDLNWERAGRTFEYQRELLPFEELVRVSARAASQCRRYGVPLSDQMDFGGAMAEMFGESFEASIQTGFERLEGSLASEPEGGPGAHTPVAGDTSEAAGEPSPEPVIEASPEQAELPSLGGERLPACHEPWTSLYILRRGILPCCYGGSPVGEMLDHAEVWNSAILQEIRGELAQGRFHRYCLDSPSCPIVRKAQHSGALPGTQALFLRAREAWHRVDRSLFGLPGRIYRPAKWVGMRLWAAVTDPHYVPKDVRRLLFRNRREPRS